MVCVLCFFFKQKTADEMRISGWSSDVCSSDLEGVDVVDQVGDRPPAGRGGRGRGDLLDPGDPRQRGAADPQPRQSLSELCRHRPDAPCGEGAPRSEEHTSELQSLMRISYAVFCLKKKTTNIQHIQTTSHNT